MSIADELWEWIRHPLEELKRSFTAEPEKSWDTRREDFLQRLGIRDPGEHPVTEQMFSRLDQMSDEERGNHVSSGELESHAYDLVKQHAASQPDAGDGQATATGQQGQASGPGYDEGTWQSYLQGNATQWNGSQETWDQFAQWFIYYAQDIGVGEPATALIQYLGQLSPEQRISELARYGVTISPAIPHSTN
jgi:hypothetical protein